MRVWCRLCLLIGIITLSGFPIIHFGFVSTVIFSNIDYYQFYQFFYLIGVGFFLTTCIILINNQLKDSSHEKESADRARRIKFSPEVFHSQLVKGEKLSGLDDVAPGILLGHPNSIIKIDLVISLYCDPCAEVVNSAIDLLLTYTEKVSVNIILKPSSLDLKYNYLAGELITQYRNKIIFNDENKIQMTKRLFNDWYRIKDPERFKSRYDIPPISGQTKNSILIQSEWINKKNILYTPTTLINGFLLSKNYDLSDLYSIIPAYHDYLISVCP